MLIRSKYPHPVKLFFVVFFVFSLSACAEFTPEEISPQVSSDAYSSLPDQISPENWREFIHAPMDVLEKFREDELKMAVRTLSPMEDDKNKPQLEKTNRVFLIKGSVKAFDGNWKSIPNVQIESAGSSSISFSNLNGGSYNYLFGVQDRGPVCMSYETEQINGLSFLDLILIKKHMAGTNPFTSAREFLAADVNRDGQIDDVDVFHLESLLLERESELPDTENVIFISENQLSFMQALIDSDDLDRDTLKELGRISSCQDGALDRFLIKTGDVNGTVIF